MRTARRSGVYPVHVNDNDLSDRQDDSDKSAQQVTCLKTKIIPRYILYLDIIVYILCVTHSVNAKIIYMCFEFFQEPSF